MNRTLKKDPGFGVTFAFSLLLHLTLFGIIYQFNHWLQPIRHEAQTYYVDLVNLPVAHPQSGTPSTTAKNSPRELAQVRQEMKLPSKPRGKTGAPTSPSSTKKDPKDKQDNETGEEFSKRLAKLEKKIGEKEAQSALEAIRNKTAVAGRAGIPGGLGKEAGSDYASYVRSRLKDAFDTTVAYQSKNPEIVIRLKINSYGKIVGYRTERSSRDKLFEASVARAISIAGEEIKPPPGGGEFVHGFIFRPEGVGKK
jgi:colicin import membrane protein